MLYIFRVDIGTMINLDMNYALETVAHLKAAVASYCNIPIEKQVLLISGGEALEPNERVCKYTAGSSDSNPIFLFSVSTLEGSNPPVFVEQVQERDLQPEVESSLSLPDTHNTVAVRATLAQEYVKVSREQVRLCESEIHDQHLQHQGWAAALANLEDSVLALEKRRASFEEAYNLYLGKREHYRKVIQTFDDDIDNLSKIPVLPVLLDKYEVEAEAKAKLDGGQVGGSSSSNTTGEKSVSLLDWINQAGNSSLEQVADSCYRSLEQLDALFLQNFQQKITGCVDGANNQQMKEIRGLGDRLSGLEQLLLDANKKVAEQKDLAAAFLQNQARANGLKDASILPDLCASHKQQLFVMMRNHQHIVSIRKRCVKAKQELSLNLYTRLKWVMFIQRQMAETGQHLLLYYEELKRLSRRLEVMEQLQMAPTIYLATVVEVVRRKAFSEHYLKKSTIIASSFSSIYADEVKTRHIFQEKLDKHFLSTMFDGMDDLPPPFATKEPEAFDKKLPEISLADLEWLRGYLPELAASLSVPDKKTLSSLLTRSLTQNLTKEEDSALHSLQNLTDKISIDGDGLGSVSVMNRICYDAVARKKNRLEALAASRERDLSSETDSDEENMTKGKAKVPRKMTRSLPSKGDSKVVVVKELKERSRDNVSSSSVDPSSSTGNTNSSAAPSSDGSLLKQNWQSETQAEDKCREVEKLQTLLSSASEEKERMETRFSNICNISTAGLKSLRLDLSSVKSEVDAEKKQMCDLVSVLTQEVVSKLDQLQTLDGLDGARLEERQLRKEAEANVVALRRQLEEAANELKECNLQVEDYKTKVDGMAHTLLNARTEWTVEKTGLVQAIKDGQQRLATDLAALEEHHDQKMAALRLEHEIEFDAMKQQVESGERGKLSDVKAELTKLQSQVDEKTNQCTQLEAKIQLIEITTEERIKEEKEKIVSILEAGFSERQRVALAQQEASLRSTHEQAMEQRVEQDREEMCSRLEELRQKMIDSSQLNLDRTLERKDKEWQTELQRKEQHLQQQFAVEKSRLEAEKQKELEELMDKTRKNSKMELDNLRSRFKFMQTTATLDRSPSMSESELSFEDARLMALSNRRIRCYSTGEYIKVARSGDGGEAESKADELKTDRDSWEKEKEALLAQMHKQKQLLVEREQTLAAERKKADAELEEARRAEKLRSEAEKQVIFNEAIRKAVEEKEQKIARLQAELLHHSQNTQHTTASDLECELAQVSRRNAQLESELREANQKLSNNMIASFAVDTTDLKQLQEENKQLRDQLTKSMTSIITSDKVSVTSADRGEIVLVIWSDLHNNYAIYHEGSILHFLHTDSVDQLGLVPERGQPRTRHLTAEVVEKEYCQARKPENRFRVAQGTKFYRVKCKKIEKEPVIRVNSLGGS